MTFAFLRARFRRSLSSAKRRTANRIALGAAAFASAAAIAGCGGGSIAHPPVPAVAQTLTLPLTLGTTGENPGPRILVALPSSTPFAMLLDTGSTGIRILPNALANIPASAYTNTMQGTSNEFGGDRVYYGTVGMANPGVTLGGVAVITKPLAFQIVTIVCSGNIPSPLPTAAPSNCTNTTTTEESNVSGGFIGVRPRVLADGLVDPLSELPAPYGNGFTVSAYGSSPKVTVGTTAANSTGFGLFSVATATAADGSAYWSSDEMFPWCYSITVPGSTTAAQACPSGGVLTDSGGLNQRLNLAATPPPGVAPQTIATLPPGSTIVATLTPPGASVASITWTETTGTCTFYDAPQVFFAGAGALSPTLLTTNGLTPFFANDILYDLTGGNFGYRAVAAQTPSIC